MSFKSYWYKHVAPYIKIFVKLAPKFYIGLWSSYASAQKSFNLSFLFWIR
jgi:hypothetical protein